MERKKIIFCLTREPEYKGLGAKLVQALNSHSLHTLPMDFTQDLHCLLSEQRRKLAAAEAMELDLDFAFRLQLQEALAASLASQPSSSSVAAIEQPVVVVDDDDDVAAPGAGSSGA